MNANLRSLIDGAAQTAQEQGVKADKEAIEQLESNGFELLGFGTYRVALKFPSQPRVVKLDNGMGGKQENRSEVKNWEAAPAEIRPHLTEIYEKSDDYTWVVQEYIPTESVTPDEVYEVRDKIKEHMRIKEINTSNTGKRRDGTTVVFDYAGT